ncbi:MAG: DUF503 domain-containing protein [Calditrichaeota bacterium]|nr:MAG: DUF503 domain-containing protein [Calditrichota bacterium]MBL1203902.1 DUF503 domain-containing protein [Calditrichota bacterium]NOG43735.1 DUF503 domain-containing protein [Calditrichota bacterium]
MIVGVLEIELHLPGCLSLKDKRMVIRSVKDRISKKFNVSVAEIDFLDKWQRASMAFATVSNSKKHSEKVLQKIFQILDKDLSFELIKYRFDYK